MQNATVPVIFQLIQGIDPAQQRNALQRAIARGDLRRQLLARFQVALQPPYRYGLIALQPDRLPGRTVLEGQRQYAHAGEIGAVDALESLADHCADTEQSLPFLGPLTR